MVLLPNMFEATSPATERAPVGYFFNHLSRSNDKNQPEL
jgi:hypothetical protein